MKTLIRSSAVALLSLVSANAVAAPFEGPYVGVQAGYNRDELGTIQTPLAGISVNEQADSFVGGIIAGYDAKIAPRVVVGVEAGFSIAADDEVTQVVRDGIATIDPKHSFDASARLGYLIDDKTLVYARGGYVNARVKTSVVNPTTTRRAFESLDGWQVGGGIERSLTDRISTRLEYRYADLSEGDGKYDRHQVLMGVAYRF